MGKLLNQAEINRIIYLRKRGRSLPEIKHITGHSNDTIFRYIQGVEMLPPFKKIWESRRKSSTWRSLQQKRKAEKEATKLIKTLRLREKAIIATCLYWAEGAKRDFSFSNTDPDLIKTFILALKELGIEKERLSLSIRIYEDLNREESCNFWAQVTGIPREQIKYVDILKGKKQGKLPYGMCRIRVIKGGYFLKLLNASQKVILRMMASPHSLMEKTKDS